MTLTHKSRFFENFFFSFLASEVSTKELFHSLIMKETWIKGKYNGKSFYRCYFECLYIYRTSHDLYHRDYFAGVEKNLELMLKYYGQQWVLRLYYEIPAKSKTWTRLCQLVCNSTNIDICDVSAIPALGIAKSLSIIFFYLTNSIFQTLLP